MSETIRWGILGAARIADGAVAPAIRAAGNATLVAVAARSADRAAVFAAKHEIARSYGNYEALLADPGVDAVYIPLPNSEHHPWTLRALEAGKHVLCEKSASLNAREAKDMAAKARETGKLFLEAFASRYHPQYARLAEIVAAGTLGEVRSMRSHFCFNMERPDDIRWDPALGGGALLDIGCYCVNSARLVLGAEPTRAFAVTDVTERGVDLSAAGVLEFDGATLTFDCSFGQYQGQRLSVSGTRGELVLLTPFGPKKTVDTVMIVNDEVTAVPAADQYQLMVEDFSAAVIEGRDPRFTAEDAIRQMHVLDALFDSAKAGRAISVGF